MKDLGLTVKELRNKNNMTLKELSNLTGLSTGYLSQFERGMTTIAVEYLTKFSEIFNVSIEDLIVSDSNREPVIRSYQQNKIELFNNSVYKHLSGNFDDGCLVPKIVEILPSTSLEKESIESYPHHGEEFIYVLQGVLTLNLDGVKYILYEGDSCHYKSSCPHNWENETLGVVRFIAVNNRNCLRDYK